MGRLPSCLHLKAMTPVEQYHASIKYEMLAFVIGAEHFCTFIFRQYFTVESDHKPLEKIHLKNIAVALM